MGHENVPEILLVTTKNDLSADLLVAELGRFSVPCLRWNVEDFPSRMRIFWAPETGGTLRIAGREYPLDSFKSIWYRRTVPADLPSGLALGGVANFVLDEVAAFLEGIWQTTRSFWVNDPVRVRMAEKKMFQLALAKHAGFEIPKTLVTNDAAVACEFIQSVPAAIAKSISRSGVEIDGESWSLFTHSVNKSDLATQSNLEAAPCIFQERLARRSDIRVTVVGSRFFAAEILLRERAAAEEIDWRAAAAGDVFYRELDWPPDLEERCRVMMNELGLQYGCFDFIRTPEDRFVFLEINPSGQWGWIEHELGIPITKSLAQLLLNGGG